VKETEDDVLPPAGACCFGRNGGRCAASGVRRLRDCGSRLPSMAVQPRRAGGGALLSCRVAAQVEGRWLHAGGLSAYRSASDEAQTELGAARCGVTASGLAGAPALVYGCASIAMRPLPMCRSQREHDRARDSCRGIRDVDASGLTG